MSQLTYEMKVALFGQEVADAMQAEEDAAKGGGGVRLPFTTLDKVSDIASPLGAFGDFVHSVVKEKNATSGEWEIKDNGVNLGKDFQFIAVSIFYRYKRWNETTSKNEYSSIFKMANDGDSAVDYKGNALPKGKDAKKDAGWGMQKCVAGVVRKNAKDKFVPVVWEMTGKLFYTYNEVERTATQPILGGLFNIVTKLEKQGSTNYAVIDTAKTKVEPLPQNLFTDYKDVVSDVTLKIRDYVNAKQGGTTTATSSSTTSTPNTTVGGDDGWD